MSKIRGAIVAVVSIVVVVAVIGAVVNRSNRHHPPDRPAAVVRKVAPTIAAPPIPPSADFDADTFVNLLMRLDPTTANKFVDALSSADRAVLATDLETRVGLSAG